MKRLGFPWKALVLLGSFACALAFAQLPNEVPDATAYSASVATTPVTEEQAKSFGAQALQAFKSVVTLANNAINSIRGNTAVKAYGERLTIMLTGIVIVWGIIKNIALKQSLPQLVGDLVFPLVIAAFVIGAGIGKLPEVVDSSIAAISGIFGAGGADGMEIGIASNLLKSATLIWNASSPSQSEGSIFGVALSAFAMLLLRIGIILLIVVAAGLAVAAILVAKFQMALAIALAPLLIPWLVFKPTEFLFSGWLNFFLKAGFGIVGVFAVSSVVIAGSKGMANLIENVPPDSAAVVTYLAMGGMAIILTYLMLKAADIGEGIISGGATGIGQLTSVAKGSAASTPGRLAASSAGLAGSAAKLGAAQAAGKALQGKTLSSAGQQMVQRSFGNATLARATFERAKGSTRAPPTPPNS